MNDDCQYMIRADLPGKIETPAMIGAKFLDTLDALNRIDPIFPSWVVVDPAARSAIPLAQARARIAELATSDIELDDSDIELDDGDPPGPDEGYMLVAMSPIPRLGPDRINFSVSAGGRQEGDISLAVGDYMTFSDKAMVTYPVFKPSLLAIKAIWRAPWISACVYKADYDKAPLMPGMPLFPYSRFHLSWISYLSAPLAAGLELPAEILTERTPDGGLLMIAAEERLEPTNPDHLRRSLIISETMIARSGVESR